jgi:hypothetical protein
VIGPADEIERFRNGLPGLEQVQDDGPLWHHAKVKVGYAGFLCVAASRNYGGQTHAAQMVYEFPALTFLGELNIDMDPSRYWVFDGRGGRTTWHEFTIETTDEMRRPDPIKEKSLIARLIDEGRSRLLEEQT